VPERALAHLSPEVEVGAYRMQLPPNFHLEAREPEAGRQSFVWKYAAPVKGPAVKGAVPQLEVTITPAAREEPQDAIEKALASSSCLRVGWNCSLVQRGEINGLLFHGVSWAGLASADRQEVHGFVYAARDGDVLISIAGRGSDLDEQAVFLAQAAARTFRKPAARDAAP
jgi:hypothetical protein